MPAPDPLPLPELSAAKSVSTRLRARGWIVLAVAVAGIGGWLAVSRYSPGARGFELTVDNRGREMQLVWDRNTPVIARATSGLLTIRDGAARRVIPLSPAQLREGTFVYTRQTGDAQIDMEILTPAGKVSWTVMAAVPWSGRDSNGEREAKPDSAGRSESPSEPSHAPSVWTYSEPLLTICSMLSLAGLLRLRFRKKAGLVWAGLLGFVLISWPPLEWLASRPLESPYPVRLFQLPPGVQAIVVLSAGVDAAYDERPFPLPDQSTLGRCEFAAWIYRDHPALPVLVSGGGEPQHLPLAATMRALLLRAGVPGEMIWTEERSANTYENALYSSQILRGRGIHEIALVVEARNMLRAAACFRKLGLIVVPAPSAFREWGPLSQELFPNWRTIQGNEATLHELGGLAWYWLHGRI